MVNSLEYELTSLSAEELLLSINKLLISGEGHGSIQKDLLPEFKKELANLQDLKNFKIVERIKDDMI